MTIIVTGGAGFIGSNFIFHMLDKYPELKRMYDPDDGNTQVLYFKNATAVIYSFTSAPETYRF